MKNDLISRSALLPELQSYKEGLSFVFESLEPGVEKRVCGAEICGVLEALIQVNKAPAVDAVEVVRCKDCENRGDETLCPMCYEECYEIDEGDGYYDTGYILHDRTHDEGFCDRGKRRADDGK